VDEADEDPGICVCEFKDYFGMASRRSPIACATSKMLGSYGSRSGANGASTP
jgi:hypothetical protein